MDSVNLIYYLKGGDMYVLEVPKRLPEAPLQAVKREILVECEEKRKVKPWNKFKEAVSNLHSRESFIA